MTPLSLFFFIKSFACVSLVYKLVFINGGISVISSASFIPVSTNAKHFMCASHTRPELKMPDIPLKAIVLFCYLEKK